REPRIVKVVCRKQGVTLGKPVVETPGNKVFVRHLPAREREYAGVALAQQAAVRHRIKVEVSLRGSIHGDVARRDRPIAGGRRRHRDNVGHTKRLADRFVVSKEECLILYDGSATRRTILISSKW